MALLMPSTSTTLQGSSPTLQGGSLQGGSVGVQTTSPVNNIKPPTNTTSTPAQIDKSGTYANVGGTIYNKQSGAKFSNQADFFKDSGLSSFNNVKFDTGYTPTGKESIYGQPAQVTTNTSPIPPVEQNSASNTPPQPVTTPESATGQYSPPNQGTTGVSQGGIIGNLINTSQTQNPNYTAALKTIDETSAQQAALNAELANQTNNIKSSPIDLSLAGGQQGLLNQLFASKQAALAPKYNAAIAELGAANTQQSLNQSALSSAGGLNAPQFVTPGQVQVNPSAPVLGSTTSGAQNLNSLIGQRTIPGQKQSEFYNTQTGKGFANPQELADFVNQQQPGINATAQNVFQILQQQGQGGNNIVGGNTALNPLSQIPQLVSQIINNPAQYSQALSTGGNIPNFKSALDSAIRQANPSFDFNAAIGSGTGQQSVVAGQTQTVAQAQSAHQQAMAIVPQLTQLIASTGVNPSDFNAINKGIQFVASNTSDPNYQKLNNLITEIASSYSQVLSRGGDVTNQTRSTAAGMIDSLASGASITDVLNGLDSQAQAVIKAIPTQPSGSPVSSGLQMPDGFFKL